MVEVVVGDENLWVTEVVTRIAVVGAVECPEFILCPGLEVGRYCTHHHLAVLAVAVVARVIDIIGTILLVGAARTKCSILLIVVGAVGQHLAEGLIVGTVLGRYAPDGMETMTQVVGELLKVEHLEVASLLIVERHGVADAAY